MKKLLFTVSVAALFLATGTAHAQVSNNYVPIPRPDPRAQGHAPPECVLEFYATRHSKGHRFRCYDKLGHGRWLSLAQDLCAREYLGKDGLADTPEYFQCWKKKHRQSNPGDEQ